MKNLRKVREARGVIQQAVADYLGISQQAYANYEACKRQANHETQQKLADYFEVSVDYLLGREVPDQYEGPLEYAAFGGTSDLTPKEKEEMETFLRFLIARREKELEDKNP